jgi:hypothetical protein
MFAAIVMILFMVKSMKSRLWVSKKKAYNDIVTIPYLFHSSRCLSTPKGDFRVMLVKTTHGTPVSRRPLSVDLPNIRILAQ